jgi:hypothetical protein
LVFSTNCYFKAISQGRKKALCGSNAEGIAFLSLLGQALPTLQAKSPHQNHIINHMNNTIICFNISSEQQ